VYNRYLVERADQSLWLLAVPRDDLALRQRG
jgi:hypothetical protein